jgi:hypothetical protein
MFKPIPGNPAYHISLTEEVRNSDGEACTLPIVDSRVGIMLYGRYYEVTLSWLSLFAHFEVHLPAQFQHRILDVEFVDKSPLLRGGTSDKLMVLHRPMIIDAKYRIVPGFPGYAIDKCGDLRDIRTGDQVKQYAKKDWYCVADVYDPDRGEVRTIGIHRLVCLAWIKNHDPVQRPIVNHIDGIKSNNHYFNLEWVSFAENAIHAFETGLREDNVPCRIRDVTTGEVIGCYSLTEAQRRMGYEDGVMVGTITNRLKSRLINDRYELRLEGDLTPWFYEDKDEVIERHGRYTVHVTLPDGQKRTWYDVRTASTELGLPRTNYGSSEQLVVSAQAVYPGIVVEFEDNFKTGWIQALEVATGIVVEAESMRALSRKLGVTKTLIRTNLRLGPTREVKGYAFRYKSDEPWPESITPSTYVPKCILAVHPEKVQLRFTSLRQAAKHFKIDRETIKLRLNTDRDHEGWKFSEVNE